MFCSSERNRSVCVRIFVSMTIMPFLRSVNLVDARSTLDLFRSRSTTDPRQNQRSFFFFKIWFWSRGKGKETINV